MITTPEDFEWNKTPINSFKKITWTEEEDKMLLESYKTFSRDSRWKLISAVLKIKSPNQCYRRYKTINPVFKKGRWSKEEDYLLLKLVNFFGRNWTFISKILKNRSNKQIRDRYEDHLNPILDFHFITHIHYPQ